MTVTVYSTSTCPWCTKAKDFIASLGVPFEAKDITGDKEAAMFIVKKTKQMGVPVIQIGEKFIVGFSPSEIESELKAAKLI